MEKIQFNQKSTATIQLFDNLEECAGLTVPDLTSGSIALSGGSTYSKIFSHWVRLSPDCSNASFFPVDERIVPFDDPQSNWGAAYNLFLKPLKKESDRNHFAVSLEKYNEIINHYFKNKNPVFDVIFLGVGDDGHTASLFPEGKYFDDCTSIILQTKSPKPPFDRITLAPQALISAKKVITIITGSNKKHIVHEIMHNNIKLPIVKILSQRAGSDLYIDRGLMD